MEIEQDNLRTGTAKLSRSHELCSNYLS